MFLRINKFMFFILNSTGTVVPVLQYAPKVLSGVYVIIASPLGITAPCSFFLCVGLPLWMLLTKFHQPQTKTFCLRGDIVDRTTE